MVMIQVLVFIFIARCLQGDKVPSTADIDDYNDPVLKEIFSKGKFGQTQVNFITEIPKTPLSYKVPSYSNNIPYSQINPASPPYLYNGRYSGEIPNKRGFQTQQVVHSNNQYIPQSHNGETVIGQLAVQGARNFYSGVQQAGHILGFDFGR